MANNDQVTIWGGVPRFGTTPTEGQAIAGGGNGFGIYESAKNNIGTPTIAQTPVPNKNMELADKTVAGVNTKYYGFAGYCGSYYSNVDQLNLALVNLVSFQDSQVQYLTNVTGSPLTRLTALNPGTYRISGTLDFILADRKTTTTQTITLSGSAPLSANSATVTASGSVSSATCSGSQSISLSGDPQTITVNGSNFSVSGQTTSVSGSADLTGIAADLSGVTADITLGWTDLAYEGYANIWLKKNGSDIPWTNRSNHIFSTGEFGRLIVVVDYMVYLDKDEYVEIAWSGLTTGGAQYNKIYLVVAATNYPSALINMTLVR